LSQVQSSLIFITGDRPHVTLPNGYITQNEGVLQSPLATPQLMSPVFKVSV